MDDKIKKIRESEKRSHIEIYANETLYQTDSWLKKPIKAVTDILPLFHDYKELKVLDLGCGVGRNSICIARKYKHINCTIDCVDLLELAIEKLQLNANEYDVQSYMNGIVLPIEDYTIPPQSYDLILAVSALEHVATNDIFLAKLAEIRDGIRTI